MTCEPVLFHTGEPVLASFSRAADADGLPAAVVVDWEERGKERRQAHARMAIGLVPSQSHDDPAALARVRRHLPQVPVICRVDGPGDLAGVDAAIAGGAAEVLLPMVRHEDEVDRVVEWADGRIGVGVMVETREAVDRVDQLAARPLSRAYLGLVDLALDRGTSSIFAAFTDGVVDHVASHVAGTTAFGVGGLTLPGHGDPVPVELLAGEILRVGSHFSFLRRSFLTHLASTPPDAGIRAVRGMLAGLDRRTPAEVERDRVAFGDRCRGEVPA